MALRRKMADDITTDEAGGSGDADVHGKGPLLRAANAHPRFPLDRISHEGGQGATGGRGWDDENIVTITRQCGATNPKSEADHRCAAAPDPKQIRMSKLENSKQSRETPPAFVSSIRISDFGFV
jgi:hypothetical protein